MEFREVAGRYIAIAEGLDARVDACTGADWFASTPCPDWTTRDIVDHVVRVHRSALALLDDRPDGDDAGEDVAAAWRGVTAAMRDALLDPARATRLVTPRFGEMSFEDLVSRMVCSDTLVHTWDIARATGQEERLDEHAVEVAWSWMEPAGDRLRASGDFGPAVTPPDGADTQTTLLCFLGRAVARGK